LAKGGQTIALWLMALPIGRQTIALWLIGSQTMVFQPIMPRTHNKETINPAPITPRTIAINAYLNLILNNDAATTPLQAPVIGSGIATNIAKPKASYFCTASEFFLVRSKSQSKNFAQSLNFLSRAEIGSNRKSAGIIMLILPSTDNQNALYKGIPKDKAKGIAPLNSDIGKAPTIITAYSLGISFNQFTIKKITFGDDYLIFSG
jgi:hypothetical protein